MFNKVLKHCFLILFFSLISLKLNASQAYKLIDFGLEQTDFSQAIAVNDNGLVLGFYFFNGKGYYFLWNEMHGLRVIDIPENYEAKFLNNKGQIAGEYYFSINHKHGFFWDPSTGVIDIGTLGGNVTRVYDMNDHGQIVGSSISNIPPYHNSQGQTIHAYVWDNGIMIDLGTLIGELGLPGTESCAVAINNHGHIVGTSNYLKFYKGKLNDVKNKGVIWYDYNQIQTIDPEGEIIPLSINDNDCIIYNKLNDIQICFLDLKTMHSRRVNSGNKAKLYNNGHILIGNNLFESETNKSFSVNGIFDSLKYHPWNYFWQLGGISNKKWIVGSAMNIYGEYHAVVMITVEL